MNESVTSFAAPLGTSVKCLTALSYAALVLILASTAAVSLISPLPRWSLVLALAVSLTIAIGSPLMRIRGYQIDARFFSIRYGFWRKRIPLVDIHLVECRGDAFQGAFRLFGNGGLWSVLGLFYSRRLGRFKAYVSDLTRIVLLKAGSGTCLVSPENPDLLVAALRERLGELK